MKYLIEKIITFILALTYMGQIYSQVQNGEQEQKSIIQSFYLSGVDFNNSFDYEKRVKKNTSLLVSGDVMVLGGLTIFGEILLNSNLAVENDWNLWIDIPCAIALSMATAIPFGLICENIVDNANAIKIESSEFLFSSHPPLTDTARNIVSAIQGRIYETPLYHESKITKELNNLLAYYRTNYTENSAFYAECLMWCGMICSLCGDNRLADAKLQDACAIFRQYGSGPFEGRDTLQEIFYHDALAQIYNEDGVEFKAIRHAQKSYDLKTAFFGEKSEVALKASLDLAVWHAERLNRRKSRQFHNKGYDAYVDLLKREFLNRTASERSLYWETANKYVGKTMDLAYRSSGRMQRGREGRMAESAYNAMLLYKGILLNANRGLDNHVAQCEDEDAQQLLDELKSMAANDAPQEALDSVERLVLNVLEKDGHPFSLPHLSITWKDVQAAMGEDDLAVEFYRTEKKEYGAVMIRNDWKFPQMIRLGGSVRIEGKRLSLDDALKQNKYDALSDGEMENLWNLSKCVWPDEIIKYFPKTDDGNVYFSIDGEMQTCGIEYLPLVKPCLKDGKKDYHSLSDVYTMHRLSSTRVLCMPRGSGDSQAAVFGGLDYGRGNVVPPLYGSRVEADSVSDILANGFNVNSYFGSDGSERAFKSLSGRHDRIIHVATHGFFYDENDSVVRGRIWRGEDPLKFTGLYMAGANGYLDTNLYAGSQQDEGLLTSLEISSMNLSDADIVVLSACETAQGGIYADGVFGLQRGLKMAGVQSILMSLWKVDDIATQMLMTAFYENYVNKKMRKQDALRTAQAYVRDFEVDEVAWEITRLNMRELYRGGPGSYSPSTRGMKRRVGGRTVKPFESPKYWAAFILLDGLD